MAGDTAAQRVTAAFIDDVRINEILAAARRVSRDRARSALTKAAEGRGLEPAEAAVLMEVEDPELLGELFSLAAQLKERIYGKRIVLFAPLYISNHCVNNCRYCGYRRDNPLERRRLTMAQLAEEVVALEGMGHKRLALECGEDPANTPLEYVLEAIQTIYTVKERTGSIRRVNVNIAATTVPEYRRLKQAGIGTYILFQETYHRNTYLYMHPAGPKHDYDWHTTAIDRAMQAGIDDVGLGVLFGLYDHKYELVALLEHARHLEETWGVGPHTVSVPRLKPAAGVEIERFPHLVSEQDFRKLVAVIRLALPYTGIILSTRERAELRDQLLHQGVSQISAGSCTGVGGYRYDQSAARRNELGQRIAPERTENREASLGLPGCRGACEDEPVLDPAPSGVPGGRPAAGTPQFLVEDRRTPDEAIRSICAAGFIPSYCTACYREGRTGDRFMALAKSGRIQYVCQPNAILTFKEYLLDYAAPATRTVGEQTILEHLRQIPSDEVRRQTVERLRRLEQGERDLYF